MKTIAELKKDLEFNTNLSSLIEVLKNIAVAQYRILEKKLKLFDKLSRAVKEFLSCIDISVVTHPFLIPQNKRQIVVAVTSDSGLLGGLNIQAVNMALKELQKIPGKLVVIGERGKLYARGLNTPFIAFGGIKDETRYSQAMQLRDYVIARFFEESMGYIKVIYPKPVSFTVQRIDMVSFAPFSSPEVSGNAKNTSTNAVITDIIMESKPADLVEYLIYLWMGEKLYEIFGLSRLAEFAARFVHLEESSQRLKDVDKKLRLQYFRVRHELIDRNMRELFAARLLYGSKSKQ